MDSLLLDYHATLINDQIRVDAYVGALSKFVKPGMRVLDIGTGTGFLAIASAKLGAEVYAIDRDLRMIRYASRVAAANDVKIVFIHDAMENLSLEAIPPVDLIVTETLGHFLLEERIIPLAASARRFLKPGGRIVPSRISAHFAFVFSSAVERSVSTWKVQKGGISFTPLAEYQGNLVKYERRPEDSTLMSDKVEFPEIQLMTAEPGVREFRGMPRVTGTGLINALTLGWKAWLSDDHVLNCSPGVPWPNSNWYRGLFPIEERQVTEGESLDFRVTCDDRDPVTAWTWSVENDRRSTVFGVPA